MSMDHPNLQLVSKRTGSGNSTADQLRAEINEFRTWRCHHDELFNNHFLKLQNWQVDRLKQTHDHLLKDERYRAATEFFLSDMYGGLDLTELANEVERALPIASRLLPDSVLRTSGIALELNSLTGELDQRMTEVLFEEMQIQEITPESYCEAYRRTSHQDARIRQLDLFAALGLGLDRYVRSRVIYATFKLAFRPAHLAGFGGLYDFLEKGFAVMKPMGSAVDFINSFAQAERSISEKIMRSDPNPFALNH